MLFLGIPICWPQRDSGLLCVCTCLSVRVCVCTFLCMCTCTCLFSYSSGTKAQVSMTGTAWPPWGNDKEIGQRRVWFVCVCVCVCLCVCVCVQPPCIPPSLSHIETQDNRAESAESPGLGNMSEPSSEDSTTKLRVYETATPFCQAKTSINKALI